MAYRITRNFEASIIDFLNAQFESGWGNITVEKTFKRIYGLQMDVNKQEAAICVRALNSNLPKAEIGTNAITRTCLIVIDIFATSDGQREDLKDFIIDEIKSGCPFYQYVISNGTIVSKTQCGRIRVLKIDDAPVNFNTDKSSLAVADRYRHILSLTVSTGKIEE
jgi:hypothetical protein